MEILYPATIGNITRIEYGGQLVLTTAQLAEFYDCNPRNISENFKNNEDRFIKGKHFFKLDGGGDYGKIKTIRATRLNCEQISFRHGS